LLLTAERMFADHGLEGVSMRELARAAGQGNNYAVQHYFGDKEGLARAVQEMRMTELNVVRTEFLRQARARGELDLRTLVEATYLPIASVVDEQGRHIFARFRARVGVDAWGLMQFAPAGVETQALMRERLSHLSSEEYSARFKLVTSFFLAAVASRDADVKGKKAPAGGGEAFLREVITICVAALEAPSPGEQAPLSPLPPSQAPPRKPRDKASSS